MRALKPLLLYTLVAASSQAGFFQNMFHHDVVVITSTDLTDEGKKLPVPSTKSPVYYVAVNVGYQDFGGVIAGDKIPPSPEMVKVIAKVLAKQGFLPATTRHPPTQIVAYAWGTMYNETVPSFDPRLPDIQLNRAQKMKFLGGEKMGLYDPHAASFGSSSTSLPELTIMSPDQEMITSTAKDDLYVAALTGYDYRTLAQSKKAVALWKTRISCPSLGLSMDETLPTMLAIATPFIGRETAKPVWIDASDKYKPDIKIGDTKLEQYLDSVSEPAENARGKGSDKKSK